MADNSITLSAGTVLRFADPKKIPISHIKGWIINSFTHYKNNLVAWLLISTIFVGSYTLVSYIPYVGEFINIFIPLLLIGGIVMGLDKNITGGKKLEITTLLAGFQTHLKPLLLLGALTLLIGGIAFILLIALVQSLTMIAILLAIFIGIPLVFALLAITIFSIPLVTLNNLRVTEALLSSVEADFKNRLSVTLLFIANLLISYSVFYVAQWMNLGSSMALGISIMMAILITPFLVLLNYFAYRDLFTKTVP